MSLNVGSLDKGAQGGSGTPSGGSNTPVPPVFRVVMYEGLESTTINGATGRNIEISPASDPDHLNLGNLRTSSTVITLPVGKFYKLSANLPQSQANVNISIRTAPQGGSQRSVEEWEQSHAQYYNVDDEGTIFSFVDLRESSTPEEVVLHISSLTGSDVSIGTGRGAIQRMILQIEEW